MLFIVGTPIGNLDDLSIRQAKTLASADIILSEDTRSTGLLLQKIPEMFGIQTKSDQRLISYYKEKEFEKLPEVLDLIDSGKTIVLISQAGMPLVSDPGLLLVKTLIKKKIPFTIIPGPTAATMALVASGINPEYSMFIGFLPKKKNEIKKLLVKLLEIKKIISDTSFICYESPNRIKETLEIINEIYPDNNVTIARELTKKFEEVVHGPAKKLMLRDYRGEITLVVS